MKKRPYIFPTKVFMAGPDWQLASVSFSSHIKEVSTFGKKWIFFFRISDSGSDSDTFFFLDYDSDSSKNGMIPFPV